MPRNLTIESTVTLNTGLNMPLFGLGTYQAHGREVEKAVKAALDEGYRLIDTAAMYGNEEEVGKAIRESGIAREDIFVTTKLWNSDHGYENALNAFEKSLNRLDIGYIDLFLIHWPVEGLRADTWRAFEELYESKQLRAIGVSNYLIHHLKDLLQIAQVPPAVDQVEFSPFLYQKELLEFCHKNDIRLEAYSPLTKGRKLDDPELRTIAEKYDKSVAQLLIRWSLQHDIITIPKSSRAERIQENARVFDFEISDEDMKKMDSMNEDLHTAWNPSSVS
jgi:diketogulonate reductase-like aldo/keto reductase